MKLLKISILFCSIFLSCDQKKQEINLFSKDEIIIPSVEKNKIDTNFTLINGVLLYEDKPYSGSVKEFYSDGNLKSISQYNQGKREGTYFGFYADSKKWFERYYTNGLKSGIHKGWHTNGLQMFEYYFNNKGVYHGSVKDWHFSGILGKHFNFVDGKETGSQKMWDLKGKIRANFYTVNNERHGLIGLKNCVSVLTKDSI
ncbi:MAG: antitoxin component YwqK of YwqJK toxin-antitoxin module [Polaribacter sp.]